MSKLNAQKMATELRTQRNTFYLTQVHAAIEEAYQNALNEHQSPEDCVVTVDFVLPSDITDILKGEGFILNTNPTQQSTTISFPKGEFKDVSEEEAAPAEKAE